jgi:hypothetical protein
MKRKKLVVAEKREIISVPGARIVSPEISRSKGIQSRHLRKYEYHRTVVNPERTTQVMFKPGVECRVIRLPGPTIRLPPVIHRVPGVPLLDDANRVYLKAVIEDILNKPWNYLIPPSHNVNDWNNIMRMDILPKVAIIKENWDKTSKNDDAVVQVARFIDNIMSEAKNMAKVLNQRRISLAKQRLFEDKIVELYSKEWMANSETVIPLDIADYFLNLFRSYWDGDISRDELNVHLGGDLWDIEAKIGEEL